MIEWRKYEGKLNRYEFDSPDAIGSGDKMQVAFLDRLFDARIKANVPFIFSSGFRTPSHNKEVEGGEDSSHLTGWAADIQAKNSRHRFLILKALLDAGFTRIGIYSWGFHVDSDPSKPKNVIWYK